MTAAMTLHDKSNFRNKKQIVMMNVTIANKEDIIVEIANSPINKEKSVFFNTTKISNTHHNPHIPNILVSKPIKPSNKLTILTQTFLLLVITFRLWWQKKY